MTALGDLAGGVICAGFAGTSIDKPLARRLSDLRLAGVVLFARNTVAVEQTRSLTDELRAVLDKPLIAIDQEGGRVMRLRSGVRDSPPMREVGATGEARYAEQIGGTIGADLVRAGVNVDFAPVLDLALLERNTVIGDRSFGADPQLVTEMGGALARGLRSHGVMPVFKHFPGHGSTDVDTHFGLPAIDVDARTLRERDLVPFVRLLPGAPAVMTAHIIVRALDPEHPATLSPAVLTDLLRREIGFDGVCFTDCMEMDAIAKSVGTVNGAVAALRAGADCITISHRLDLAQACIGAIVDAVESGALPRTRLEEAYGRVRSFRDSLC